ncbi:hypothetical protein ACFU44_05895 [Nocardia rhizosphaerihabitans]|uniref:hypothetical protein n=1 Tax=Nocardia rhizosphaerihabitans TaxID=1691570 RepID=UPI00366C8284
MRRGRPPRPLGVPGKPMLTEISPGHWKARIYIRDTSGRRRDVTRFSPIKLNAQGRPLPDRTGQRALDAVMAAAVDVRVDLDDELSDSMTVKQLWGHYRDHLVALGRAEGTISRYDEAAKTFDAAFGGRRLFEVTTATVEAFLKEVGHARGPSNMRTARNVLSGMFRFACSRTPLEVNPVREAKMAENVEAKGRTGGAGDLTVDQLRFILSSVRTSQTPVSAQAVQGRTQSGHTGQGLHPTHGRGLLRRRRPRRRHHPLRRDRATPLPDVRAGVVRHRLRRRDTAPSRQGRPGRRQGTDPGHRRR